MALLEQPVEAIYTHTVGTGCSLKYSSPGKFQPKKQGKTRRKTWLHIDKRNAQKRGAKKWGGWIDRGGITGKHNRHGDVRWEKETEGEVKLKLSFRCGYSSITVLGQTIFADRGTANEKNNNLEQLFKIFFNWDEVSGMREREKGERWRERERERGKSTVEQICII